MRFVGDNFVAADFAAVNSRVGSGGSRFQQNVKDGVIPVTKIVVVFVNGHADEQVARLRFVQTFTSKAIHPAWIVIYVIRIISSHQNGVRLDNAVTGNKNFRNNFTLHHFLSSDDAWVAFFSQKLRGIIRLLAGRKRSGGRRETLFLRQFANVPVLHFFARPGGFAQEREAGFHCGIKLKAPDGNAPAHLIPAMALNQLVDDGFQGDAVQGITGMFWHG